jgi:hypothetical protein
MTATTEIRWITPYRTPRSPSLATSPKAMASRPSKANRPPARLPNPRHEVTSGAKLRDALRW